jgi:RNA polymerase sigma factor (sigma-70 family)
LSLHKIKSVLDTSGKKIGLTLHYKQKMGMDWITALKKEPDKTLAVLYDQHSDEAMRWVKKEYNLDYDAAREFVQVAFVALYDNISTGKLTTLTASIKTYLFAIIKNKVIQYNRHNQKFVAGQAHEILAQVIAEDYEEADEADLQKSRIALHELGEPCKSLLQLYYYQSMGMDEITNLMGYKNADTTKNQKYKCLKRLQKLFYE